MFYLRLFGSPDVTGPDGQRSLSVLSQHKRLALLAYLAMATPRGFHSRDKLLALLWPDSDIDHGRNSLRQSLHFLRRSLGQDSLVNRGEGEISVGVRTLECDVVEFERALDENELRKAVELYRGDLLEGFFIPGSPSFEQWLDAERTRLRCRAVEAAGDLSEEAAKRGDDELEVRWALRAIELDPSDEASVRRVILVQGRLGNGAAAAKVYRDFEDRIAREYELKPSPETTAALEAVRRRPDATERSLPSLEPRASHGHAAPPVATPVVLRSPPATPKERRFSGWLPRLRRTGAVRLQVGVGLVVVGLFATWAGGLIPLVSTQSPSPVVKAVAVLPFRTIAPGEEDRFFAEAMHQEVLTQLSSAHALRVIALGSVVDFRIDMEDNRAVADRLGVEYLIRGALQATGSRMRVWVRLIDAKTDEQLWASSFEGDRADLFGVQATVARQVAEALETRFPVGEIQFAVRPTRNPEAYEEYLQARLHSARVVNRADAREAVAHLEKAVALDPDFAQAWAALSYTKLLLAYAFAEHGELEGAEAALRRAEALAPDGVETWLAQAYFYSYASQHYDRALVRLRQVLDARPSHADAIALQGFVQRRMGLWEEAAASMTTALELDPNSYSTTVVLAEMYMRMRRYDAAERLLDRAIAIAPGGELAYVQMALLHLNGRGDAVTAGRLLGQVSLSPKNHGLPALVALFRRDYSGALAWLESSGPGGEVRSADEMILLALVHRLRGEQESAIAWADSVRRHLELGPLPAEMASVSGGVWPLANFHSYSAMAFALAGRDTEAVADAEKAASLMPLSHDAYAGTEALERLAEVYALTGRTGAAIATLDRLLSVPSRITPHVIRLHPVYQPLRGDPAFTKLLERYRVPASD